MRKGEKMKNQKGITAVATVVIIFVILFIIGLGVSMQDEVENGIWKIGTSNSNSFRIISSSENKDLEPIIKSYARDNNIDLDIEYAGTIDIMDRLNNNEKFDAVWTSNSIWLYMLNNSSKVKNSKSTSINPVVFGIKKSKANELGFVGKEVYTKDILSAIKSKKLKFSMSSATQTNTGATAYLGFVSTLAGNPEILKEDDLKSDKLKNSLKELFSGVTRSSGSDEFLEEMFLNSDYEAVVTYETSLININKKLEQQGKEPLYIIYAKDGVSISDSPFAYIDNSDENKLEQFTKLQSYILSNDGQQELVKTGRRVWYGGVNDNTDKSVFNPNWGIDTTKYLVPVKYPSTTVIKTALGIYQTELRKPIHAVFCLDYSGSMYGEGNKQLEEAMDYILDKDGELNVIEINPRLQGTYELVENACGINLLDAHIKACEGEIIDIPEANQYSLKKIIYARKQVKIGNLNIPNVFDIPYEGVKIEKDQPLVTIISSNKNLETAMKDLKIAENEVYENID